MNELHVFKKEEFGEIRMMERSGEPYICLADVCRVLALGNPRQVKTRLSAPGVITNDVGVVTGTKADGTPAMQQVPMTFISEPNFYKVVMQSRKPQAEPFVDWISSEVLPSIRKHGAYLTDAKAAEILLTPEAGIRMLQEIIAERTKSAKLSETVALQEGKIEEMQPKADYYDIILQSDSLVSVTQIAKDYGMSAVRMNQLLHDLGVQFKQGDMWLLYQEYADKGYTQSKTFAFDDTGSKQHTYWTQKGRFFLYEMLKQHGIVPMIEQAEDFGGNGQTRRNKNVPQ